MSLVPSREEMPFYFPPPMLPCDVIRGLASMLLIAVRFLVKRNSLFSLSLFARNPTADFSLLIASHRRHCTRVFSLNMVDI